MKTSEFIEYFNTKGYIAFNHYGDIVFEDPRGNEVLEIDSENNVYTAFYDLPLSKQQEYYKVIFEYLMTPPEEREEEKRYYLKLKGFDGEQPYLCAYDFWNAWILIEKDSFTHGDEFYFKFTEENIKNLPEELKAHNWEQIEVECEEE